MKQTQQTVHGGAHRKTSVKSQRRQQRGLPSRNGTIPLHYYQIEEGMGDFSTQPARLMVIAEDYEQDLLDRLIEQIKGAFSQTLWLFL
jgi:hypothetical protein